jgi:adenylate kinase family enzyme
MSTAWKQQPAAESTPASAIEAMLARIRALCHRRLLWLDQLAASGQRGVTGLSKALLNLDSPQAEQQFYQSCDEARELQRIAAQHESRIFEQQPNRLRHLCEILRLERAERDLLQVCLASSIDPGLAEVYAVLDGADGRIAPTEPLAARLCGYGRAPLWSPAGAASLWHLIEAEEAERGDPPTLRVDPYILSYVQGGSELDPELTTCCFTQLDLWDPLESWSVGEMAARILAAVERGVPSRVQIVGPPLSGRKSLAASVASQLGSPLVAVDTMRVDTNQWKQVRTRVQRQALLHGAAVAWIGTEAKRGLELEPGLLPLEFTIIETMDDLAPAYGWHEERFTMPALSSSERRELWLRFIPASGTWAAGELQHLSRRFAATVGEISHVAAQGSEKFDDVCRHTRELSRGKLGELAKLVDCPFTRDDLYVPDELGKLLGEFLFEARDRTEFWEQPSARRLFPRGTGLIGLLAGPPGTGKTMAAQVIAHELGLDLFRIDLASTVNKYIGETAKNLRRLFARAAQMNAVLLFDEADALFSRRTDVRDSHDRYANADTNYLLQLVEDYPGIALLATNKRQHMDDAFVRRVRYVLHFPRPDATLRLAIWRQVVAELAGRECAGRMGADLERLAAQAPLTGAQIKNAVLAGVFLARQACRALEFEDIRRGLERQLSNQGGSASFQRGESR